MNGRQGTGVAEPAGGSGGGSDHSSSLSSSSSSSSSATASSSSSSPTSLLRPLDSCRIKYTLHLFLRGRCCCALQRLMICADHSRRQKQVFFCKNPLIFSTASVSFKCAKRQRTKVTPISTKFNILPTCANIRELSTFLPSGKNFDLSHSRCLFTFPPHLPKF